MILSDRDLATLHQSGLLGIEPFDPAALQPASYDLHLGTDFLVFSPGYPGPIDPLAPPPMRAVTPTADGTILLAPGQLLLAASQERVRIPNGYVGRVEGKSSLGRLGLSIHLTAGYIDPGWDGVLTFELKNEHHDRPIRLRCGMAIAQLAIHCLLTPAARPYGTPGLGSRYHGAQTVQASRYHLAPETSHA